MRSSRNNGNLGDKLGPRLISAVSQSVIATKRGLLPTEHRLRVGAMQEIIDRAGHEVADHWQPIISEVLRTDGDKMHPLAKQYIEEAASGTDQLKAITGLVLGSAASTLSTFVSNALAPGIYRLMELSPNLQPDINTVVASIAADLTTAGVGEQVLGQLGINPSWYGTMIALAQNTPDLGTINQLVWRGLMSDEEASYWRSRLAIPKAMSIPYQALQHQLLTLPDAALAYLRSDIDRSTALEIAKSNGYQAEDFDIFVGNTGEPPGIQQLLDAYRRGYIDEAELKKGVLQSRVRNEWWPTIFDLRYEPPSTADSIEASIQGYMTKEQARKYADQNGLEPSAFDALWLTAGEPLSRTEMTDLWNRGFADEDQFKAALRQSRLKDSYVELSTKLRYRPMSVADAVEASVQGYISADHADTIMGENGLRPEDRRTLRLTAGEPLSKLEMLELERRGVVTREDVINALKQSRLKDSYIDWALELTVRLPELYEIRLMLHAGVIDDALATKLLREQGYQPDVIKAIIASEANGGATANKAVTEAMLVDLYLESAITGEELLSMLKADGYSKANATLIKEVADFRIELASRNALITKIRAEYVSGKIDRQTASSDLDAALIPTQQRDAVLADWDLELAANVKLLTEAQIVDAWFANLFDTGDPAANTQSALAYLARIGYSQTDALILLTLKNKGPLNGTSTGNQASSTANPPSASS